jgi:hypothetical protein
LIIQKYKKYGDVILKLRDIIALLQSFKKTQLMFQQALFIFVLLFVGVVQAQNFPSQPIKERFAKLGVQAVPTGMDESKKFRELEKVKYAKLIQDNHIKAD